MRKSHARVLRRFYSTPVTQTTAIIVIFSTARRLFSLCQRWGNIRMNWLWNHQLSEGGKKTGTLLNFLDFKSLCGFNTKQNGDVISMRAGLRADPMLHGNQFGLNKSGSRSNSEHPLEQAGSFKDSVTSILGTFISIHVVGPFRHRLRLWAKGIGLLPFMAHKNLVLIR